MESDSTRAIPEYDREQHKDHIENRKIARRSTTSDRFLFCLVSTFALPFVLVLDVTRLCDWLVRRNLGAFQRRS